MSIEERAISLYERLNKIVFPVHSESEFDECWDIDKHDAAPIIESALREERRLVLEEVISIIPRETEDVEAADFKRGWQRSGTQFLKTIRKLMEE